MRQTGLDLIVPSGPLLCAELRRRDAPGRGDERLPLATAAVRIAGMSLGLWGVIGALAWSVLG